MPSCTRSCFRSELGERDLLIELRAGVEQMLAHEQAGGDGWWKGWEMLKAAYDYNRPVIKRGAER